jgi:hypothetical protein
VCRVVAVLDQRECSIAALRRALPLAETARAVVEVVFVKRRPPPLAALASWGMLPPVVLADLDESLESLVFRQAAEVLAPSGASWTFQTVEHPAQWQWGQEADPPGITLVVAPHSSWLRSQLLASATNLVSAAPARYRLAVVSCGHQPRQPGISATLMSGASRRFS